MKFTNGFWLMREGVTPLYAVEYYDHSVKGNDLTIYTAPRRLNTRGNQLNIGMLTVRLSSPMPEVIKVSVTHFEGVKYKGPFTEVNSEPVDVQITESEDFIEYTSGCMSAVVDKRPNSWGISFYDRERLLTKTGYRNMAYMKDGSSGENYMVEQLAIDIGENLYGFGERFSPFVKNGQSVDNWNSDGGTASEQGYKCIPFFLSGKGYGVLVDNEGDVSFEVASEKVEFTQFSVKGERLDYYIINGSTPKGVIEKYTALTGRPALPPAWSFGLWLSTSFTTNYDEKTVMSFVQGMKERKIPLHVFHFDCFWMKGFEWCNFEWDADVFPNPKEMIENYHKVGLKICVWINPYIAQKSKLFQEGMENGYFLRKENGDVWQTDLWQAGMAVVDFTNPSACAWYTAKLKSLLDMGVDCFKTDFGERIPVKGILYSDQSVDPVKMHNHYTYLYNKTVFDLIKQEKGENEAIVFARSATAGSQKFPVHWGGDCSATYSSMAESLRGGLSLASSGFGFWSHDISGFEDTAPSDVYKRWCQFGLLSSHSRLHGSSSYRVPWLFDEESCDVLRKFVNLKCDLMPYIYAKAVEAHETGLPIMRPMFMEFPEDRACESLDRQYMFGDRLLVAPVFSSSGKVDYYLPKGSWVDLLTHELIPGGEWKNEFYPMDRLPLLVKPNSILVMGNVQGRVEYDYAAESTVWLSYFEDGACDEITVPDTKGNQILTVKAERHGNIITVIFDGNQLPVHLLHDESLKIEVLQRG